MRAGWIGALAATLWVEKVLLLVALAVVHDETFGARAIGAALAPELALAIISVALAQLAPIAPLRWIVGCATLALVLGTWLAGASWAYAGTVVSWDLFTRLFESPQAIATAARSEDGATTIALAVAALAVALATGRALARLLGAVARRFPSRSPASRRLAAIIGLTLATAGLVASVARPRSVIAEPAILAAARPRESRLGVGSAPIDPETARELAPRARREGHARPAVPGIRNVVIVVLESIRYEPDSAFVRGFPDAVHFERVYAHHPRSVKTLEALMFGIYPSPWRATAAWEIDRYDLDAIGALPSLLGHAGFRGSYLGSMNLMFDGYGRALERAGFERVERASGGDELTWGIAADPLLDQVATIVEEGRRAGRPQLVTAWTTECHRPYDFHARTDGEAPAATPGAAASPRDHYRACAASLAASLGRFVERLRASGAGDDTMVVAFGDHGQTFGEDHPGALAFGQHVYEPSLHVPLLLFLPPGAAAAEVAGARDERLFQIVDVPRTIAAALGLAIPPAWVGRDMLDPDEPGREHAFVLSILDSDVLGAIDRSGRKEVRARDDRLVAYDLAKDPAELAPEPLDGDRAEAAQRRLQTYLAVAAAGWEDRVQSAGGPVIFRGADLLGFGRAGPCIEARLDPAGGGILVEPRAQPECASGADPRSERIIRRLGGRTERLRLSIRLRLESAPPPGVVPRVKARIGRRSAWSERELEPIAGRWRDVELELRAPRAKPRSEGKRGRRGAGLELMPVDPPQPCAIESIALVADGPPGGTSPELTAAPRDR